MVRFALFGFVLASLLMAQGCCCGPCGHGGIGHSMDPLAADPAAPLCGGCGECIHCRRGGALQAARNLVLCHNGCGDLYYDEWFSDPAAPRDPCDYCYCPGPFRRIWWNMVALHTAPRPGCYAPRCGETCCADGESHGDEIFDEHAPYLDGEHPVEMGAEMFPTETMPYRAPTVEQVEPRAVPRGSESLEKAQRYTHPPLRATGLQIVPRAGFGRPAR